MSLHKADSSIFIDDLMSAINCAPLKAGLVSEQERQESNMDSVDAGDTHDTSTSYPLVALKSMVVFPRTRITLSMLREKSIRAVEEALMQPERVLIAVSQYDPEIEDPKPEEI